MLTSTDIKNKLRQIKPLLEDILLSMERIQEYISGKEFTTFKRDYKTVDAVIRNFVINQIKTQ